MTQTYVVHQVAPGPRPQRCGRCRAPLPSRAADWPEGERIGISTEGSHVYVIEDGRELDDDERQCTERSTACN